MRYLEIVSQEQELRKKNYDMKTAIIIPTGFDGGGSTTLGYEYDKLGLDVYFKNIIQSGQYKSNQEYKTYNTDEELISILENYDKVIISLLAIRDKDIEKEAQILVKLRKTLPHLKICYLNCSRPANMFCELLNVCESLNFEFDWVYSISPLTLKYVNNCSYMQINAYTFKHDALDIEKLPIIFTAGRVEAFKGTIRYFNAVDEDFLSDDMFYYIHEGANFSVSSNDKLSVPLQMLSLFDTTVRPKQLKSQFVFKQYGETPELHKITIYPSYNIDDIKDRWSKYYAGICCILGSHSKQKIDLFNNVYCEDRRENTVLAKQLRYWGNCMEYVNIEMIDLGIPVFISRMYANILDFHYEPLIYDCYVDIPQKIKEINTCYNEAREYQRNWLVTQQEVINNIIINKFTEDI